MIANVCLKMGSIVRSWWLSLSLVNRGLVWKIQWCNLLGLLFWKSSMFENNWDSVSRSEGVCLWSYIAFFLLLFMEKVGLVSHHCDHVFTGCAEKDTEFYLNVAYSPLMPLVDSSFMPTRGKNTTNRWYLTNFTPSPVWFNKAFLMLVSAKGIQSCEWLFWTNPDTSWNIGGSLLIFGLVLSCYWDIHRMAHSSSTMHDWRCAAGMRLVVFHLPSSLQHPSLSLPPVSLCPQ